MKIERKWHAQNGTTGWTVNQKDTVIACGITSGEDEGETHAKLMANAPAMFEALKDLCDYIKTKTNQPERHWAYLQAQLVLWELRPVENDISDKF